MKMIINDEFSAALESYTESLFSPTSESKNASAIVYELLTNLRDNEEGSKAMLEFLPYMTENSITKLQIIDDSDIIVLETSEFTKIDTINKSVFRLNTDAPLTSVQFRSTKG